MSYQVFAIVIYLGRIVPVEWLQHVFILHQFLFYDANVGKNRGILLFLFANGVILRRGRWGGGPAGG